MARHLGSVHIHSLGTAAFACADITGYATPNIQTLRANHEVDIELVKGVAGLVTGAMGVDDGISCTFDIIPEHATLIATALESASIPKAPTAFTLSGFQAIEFAGIADALNGVWIYLGGGSLNAGVNGMWTMTVPLRRFGSLTSTTAITA